MALSSAKRAGGFDFVPGRRAMDVEANCADGGMRLHIRAVLERLDRRRYRAEFDVFDASNRTAAGPIVGRIRI